MSKKINGYRLIHLIGKGGMGSVWLAEDEKLKRKVAVKIIAEEFYLNPNVIKRFKVEAIAQARLNHPNIVQIYSFEEEGNNKYIVMEYIEGISLETFIKREGRLPLKKALEIFEQVLSAIDYAHSKGVIHRDIKAANILIKKGDIPKIGDFGIAKVKGIDGITRTGSVIGTPVYSSPEQISGKKIDKRTDIYSLGILLYEMLTGNPPFKSKNKEFVEIAKKHLKEKPTPPSTIVSSIPKKLDHIILKCLEKSPDKRYQNVKELRRDILNFLKKGRKKISLPNISNLFNNDFKNLFNNFFKNFNLKSFLTLLKNSKLKSPNDKRTRLIFSAVLLFILALFLITILLIGFNGNNSYNYYNEPGNSTKSQKVIAVPLQKIIVKKIVNKEKIPKKIKKINSKQKLKIQNLFQKKKYKEIILYTEELIKKGYSGYSLYLERTRAYLFSKQYKKAKKLYIGLLRRYGQITFIATYDNYIGKLKINRKTITFIPQKEKRNIKSMIKISKKDKKVYFKIPIKNLKIKIKKPYLLAKHRIEFKYKDKKYKVNLKASKKEQLKVVLYLINTLKGGKL